MSGTYALRAVFTILFLKRNLNSLLQLSQCMRQTKSLYGRGLSILVLAPIDLTALPACNLDLLPQCRHVTTWPSQNMTIFTGLHSILLANAFFIIPLFALQEKIANSLILPVTRVEKRGISASSVF